MSVTWKGKGGIFGPALAAVVLASCQASEPAGPVTELRDSAGIILVENRGDLAPAGPVWTVEEEPLVTIGTFQGDSLYQLYEVSGARRLRDGRIALADRGSGEIRVYDGNGRFLAAHGRKGEGPGEFQSPELAGILGSDTLVVVDLPLRRISILHPDSGFIRSGRMADEIGGGGFAQGLFRNGTVLLGGGFYWSSDSGDELSDGYTRPPTSYQAARFDGALVADFGAFPGSEFFMKIQRSAGGIAMSASRIPFGKHPMTTVADDRLYFGDGSSWEVESYTPQGRLDRIIRWNRDPVPVSGQMVEAYIHEQEKAATDDGEAREIRQAVQAMPISESLPAYSNLYADDLGFLWVEDTRLPGEKTRTFHILDPRGSLVARTTLPEASEILDIGEDYVLTLFRDELEVEYLRLLRVHRQG